MPRENTLLFSPATQAWLADISFMVIGENNRKLTSIFKDDFH